jgi:hypothetical protein
MFYSTNYDSNEEIDNFIEEYIKLNNNMYKIL